ncbi:hypothetical protein [Stackebrandtia albiflava]|nr:hypothetical protein [Stackebrandtia albiflava]
MTTLESIPETGLRLSAAPGPITEPVTKLGGQPCWLDTPSWPVSAGEDEPMEFLGQFRLPTPDLRMAYLFMSTDADDTWEPDAGENALLLQGGHTEIPPFLTVVESATGPTIGADVAVESVTGERDLADRIGGSPWWIQHDESPGDDWLFLFQLTSYLPGYEINFGDAGMGYGFVRKDLTQGLFLWQCH